MNEIERAAFVAMNKWREEHGLEPLTEPEYADEPADEDEPDRYQDEIPRSEDERLDSPEYGQAEGLNKLR